MSLSLTLFHLIIFTIILARNKWVAAFHDGCWVVKFMMVATIFTLSWQIDMDFMEDYYLVMAKYTSALFLVY